SDKKGDKLGDFFYFTLSYDRDKKNEREYRVQDGEPADTDLLHTDVVQLIGAAFLFGQNGRRTFPLSSVNSDVSNDDEGRQLHRRSGWSLCRIARDSHGERKR
ncbi:hypothetical protein, partial [Bacillus haynesii]|uniref:hypothetical protein n=1 Tax=Bacillus haynesii TaxID=1925021 RepID=UPI00227F5CAC